MNEIPSDASYEITPIAVMESEFPEKFGIPRQPRLVNGLESRIVFLPEFRNEDALRGIEGYSHLWLIWQFSANLKKEFSPTVRPPRFGGNQRMGVFATRSPFRPNSLGLSCVKLERIEHEKERGAVLIVSGADLMNGTPIFDIKPYVPYSDCIPEAAEGFAVLPERRLRVEFSEGVLEKIPEEKRETVTELLQCDPRPSYQRDPERMYGMSFSGMNIKFKVRENLLTVYDV